MIQKSYNNTPTLYVVPTPIGNIEDITYRALNILKECSAIFSEDTRETKKLLNYYNISNQLYSSHNFNEDKMKPKVLELLNSNQSIAVVSDRGTPLISDPGYKIVSFIVEEGFNVVSLPGATALIPALTNSGIEPYPFIFVGFLNSKSSKRKEQLIKYFKYEETLIFYESVHRIIETLQDIRDVLPNRKISISREISKQFEEVYRGNTDTILNDNIVKKGEFVIIIEGNKNIDNIQIDTIEEINKLIDLGYKKMDALKIIAKQNNISKSDLYKEYEETLK